MSERILILIRESFLGEKKENIKRIFGRAHYKRYQPIMPKVNRNFNENSKLKKK
jgi:hypothetical protein